jgi:hypothetical protein
MTSQHRREGSGSGSMSSPEGSGSTRYTPQTASFSPSDDDDDKTLVMSARSTNTEGDFGMKEFEGGEGDISTEGMGLLQESQPKSPRRKKKLRLDTGSRKSVEQVEKMRMEELEEVDLEGEEESFEGIWTVQEEKRVIKKMDRKVVLFVALLYLLSFLDRSNIGNARIAGLERDLQLSSAQYEWLLSGFYITYIAFEWMALLYVDTTSFWLIMANRFYSGFDLYRLISTFPSLFWLGVYWLLCNPSLHPLRPSSSFVLLLEPLKQHSLVYPSTSLSSSREKSSLPESVSLYLLRH